MKTAIINKYQVKTKLTNNQKNQNFWDLAKKHIFKLPSKKEDLALNMDYFLYGKK